ncbi:MAG: TonB-dependent siderophore receptor [Ottowia sp.]
MHPKPSRLASVALAALTLCLPLAALAQTAASAADEETEKQAEAASLPTIEVRSSAMQTTTGMELSVRQTPQSVSVVNQSALRDQGIHSMEQAMRTTTGVNVIRDGGSGRVRFQSRGFYIDQMQEDGISSTVPGSSSNPVRDPQSMTDLAVYEHIEVLRGPTGLTQANGEPGGTINAVRKKPTSKPLLAVDLQADRWGQARAVIDASNSLNASKTVRGRFVGVANHIDSFKDRVDGNSGTLYGVLDWQAGSNTLVTAGALYQYKSETPDYYGVPMAPTRTTSPLPRRAYMGFDWNRDVFKKFNVFGEVEHMLGGDWRLSGKLNYIKNDADTRFGYIGSSAANFAGLTRGDLLAPNWQSRYANEGEQIGAQLNLSGSYSLLGRQHDLFAGYTYSYENSESDRRQFNLPGRFDPFTFGGAGLAEPNWFQGRDYWQQLYYGVKIISNALMLGTRFNATDRLHIMAGTRYTRWRMSAYDDYMWFNGRVDNDPTAHASRQRNRFVPYLGATFDLDESSSLYASYTSIFKPNASRDRYGNYLKPVLGNNIEVGWKAAWLGGRVNTTLALFNIDQKNRSISVLDAQTGKSYNQPLGHVRSRGLDAEINGQITPAWQLTAGYTYNTSQYRRTESSRYTAGMNFSTHTPRHMLRLHTSYRLPGAAQQWTLGASLNAQSKTVSVYNIPQGGLAVLGASAHYQIRPDMRLGLIVSNLLDRTYFENNRVRTTGINNFYAPPRTVALTLQWQL